MGARTPATTAPATWRDDAACRDADPELFFPPGATGPALGQIRAAKRICQACRAQTQCLAWALDNEVTDGVWGGTTQDERRAIRSLCSLAATELAPVGAADVAQAYAGPSHPIQPGGVHHGKTGSYGSRGFARDFATTDGERVRVEAFTRRQFADLASTTRLTQTFAFLERLVHADLSTCAGLYTHRGIIATLLAPWFARHTVAELAAAFAGTSVHWAHLPGSAWHAGRRFTG